MIDLEDNEARSFKNEMLPEKADISLLKISICISVSASGIQANLLVWWDRGEGDPEGVAVQISEEAV
jgi:hypothetical protein